MKVITKTVTSYLLELTETQARELQLLCTGIQANDIQLIVGRVRAQAKKSLNENILELMTELSHALTEARQKTDKANYSRAVVGE